MNKITLLLLLISIWLQYSLWLGKNGIIDYNQINANIMKQKKINNKLKSQNNNLFIEIKNINENQDIIEEYVSDELHMKKTKEKFYRLISQKHNT